MSTTPVTTHSDGGTLVIRMDDGKVNALGPEMMTLLDDAFDQAEADADSVALIGRDGKFSAGFDLKAMQVGPDATQAVVGQGAELCMRIYGFPRPVVAGCTGHALAAGALLLLSSDVRIGVTGSFSIGLNEVSIGMQLPVFATELARDRLSRRHFTRATALANIYSPDEAVDAGFLDQLVDANSLERTTIEQARALGDALSPSGFAVTRVNARQATIDHVNATLAADIATFALPADNG